MNQPLANNNQYENYLKELRDSTMFHMSLGSKELFHSNFLHWISIVNWDAFLQIMRDLAGLKKDEVFWWEDMKCDVEGYNGDYHPENNNIEVRREYNHFDLCIYILDSKKKSKKKSKTEENEKYDSEGNMMTEKWIPVLILENKMKSLPYEEQLERYTQKAFEEWRTGKKQDAELRNSKKECIKKDEIDWHTDCGINFILLSLIDNNPKLGEEVKPNFKSYNKSVDISFKWIHKSYNALKQNIGSTCPQYVGFQKGLNNSIIEDYCKFIEALYNLASNCWEIDLSKSYRLQLFPWNIDNDKDAENKRNEIEGYKKLRIHDIHEKLLYDQLLSMLEQALPEKSYRYSKEAIQAQSEKDKPIRLYTNSGYAHGVGIFELQYVLKFTKEYKDEEIFRLIIQVQGDRYCHMLIYNDIVKEEGKKKSVKEEKLRSIWKKNDFTKEIIIEDTLANYISIGESKPKLLGSVSDNWGKYGENLIYQYVEIPPTATIQDVIDAMANDIEKIKGWFSPIKDILY